MKIALFTNGIYPYVVGGTQKHSFYLAKYLARLGIQVDLYYAVPSDVSSEHRVEDLLSDGERVRIHCTQVERPVLPYFPGHYIRESYLISSRFLDALGREPTVDFIYAQGFTGWKAIREKQRSSKLPPIGVNFHGLEMYQTAASTRSRMQHWMFRPFVEVNLRNADIALSLGGGISRIIASLGVPPERIVDSPNGVEDTWLVADVQTRSDPLTFVFIDGTSEGKALRSYIRPLDYSAPTMTSGSTSLALYWII